MYFDPDILLTCFFAIMFTIVFWIISIGNEDQIVIIKDKKDSSFVVSEEEFGELMMLKHKDCKIKDD